MAGSKTTYGRNKVADNLYGATAMSAPATWYLGLIYANKGQWLASTVYALNDYVVPNPTNGRLYKATTGGTSSGTQPTWPTTPGGTVSDGSVVWTEQTPSILAGTAPEPTGIGSYARVSQSNNGTNFSAASGGAKTNNTAFTFPTASANWGWIFGAQLWDASSAGNAWAWSDLTVQQSVLNGNTFSIPIGSLSLSET